MSIVRSQPPWPQAITSDGLFFSAHVARRVPAATEPERIYTDD